MFIMNDLHQFQFGLADLRVGRDLHAVHFIAEKFNGDGAGALTDNVKESAAYGAGISGDQFRERAG
jgi:hypothetical protein